MVLPGQRKDRRGILKVSRLWIKICMAGIFLLVSLLWIHLHSTIIRQKTDQFLAPSLIPIEPKNDKNQFAMETHFVSNPSRTVQPVQQSVHLDTPSRESIAIDSPNKVLTFYLEPPNTLIDTTPLPIRNTSANILHKVEFPKTRVNCTNGLLHGYPIDDYPQADPFLPWIHDYFVDTTSNGNWSVRFVAQNRRRCNTGEGKEMEMKYWEPQMALFQPIPIQEKIEMGMNNRSGYFTKKYRLSSLENATVLETRFICRFHNIHGATEVTFSVYPFNYEYINWRKHREQKMFSLKGPDVNLFEFSQLMFSCPIPKQFQVEMTEWNSEPRVWMDLIPIRTPARHGKRLLGEFHVGPDEFANLDPFDTIQAFGQSHFLPNFVDSGRISNLPLCPSKTSILPNPTEKLNNQEKDQSAKMKHTFVICTWTASSYHRRGDRTSINDAAERLREWIVFHRLAGVDRIYLYDNSEPRIVEEGENQYTLKRIVDEFPDFVTYHPWPAKVCNNNRPNNKNPGERSSQYAAESSCRERYGHTTEWMAFIDSDEYLVPMNNGTWKDVLRDVIHSSTETKVLKMKSSRGRPRENLMEMLSDQRGCNNELFRKRKESLDPCLVPMKNETFLRVYNCDYIKSPRPDRFARAMKQIYQPSFVLSHFVHYSTITKDIARYFSDWNLHYGNTKPFSRRVQNFEWGDRFLDEINEGLLVHTKSVLPYETMTRSANCQNGKNHRGCGIGRACPESTVFNDTIHQENLFVDESGNFCNCWINQQVENVWVKMLEAALSNDNASK